MSNTFSFAGVNSGTMHLLCSHGGTYNAPERDVTALAVPGRNGDLVVDNGRWRNVMVAYPCYVQRGFAGSVPQIRAWLAGDGNYHRLEDDAHPGEYRMARLAGELGFAPRYLGHQAEVTVTFDCKPQRWLTAGEAWTALDPSGSITLTNPTGFDALPIIEVVAPSGGTLTVGTTVIDLPVGYSGTMFLDFQRLVAYCAASPLNHLITDFPALGAGDTIITASGITSGRIQPRWWRL